MPRDRNRRGPRPIGGQPPGPGVRGVLMPEVIGFVLRLARKDLRVPQTLVADRLDVPQTTISKLERGVITHSVYHLDLFAEAISRNAHDEDVWEGWELMKAATEIASDIETQHDLPSYWVSPRQAPPGQFVRGRELFAVVEAIWRGR